jgi:membrane-associated phospholipid phosphatase
MNYTNSNPNRIPDKKRNNHFPRKHKKLSTSLYPLLLSLVFFTTPTTTFANPNQVAKVGDVLARYVLPASALLITAYHKDLKGLAHYGMSLGTSLAFTQTLKMVTQERRPNGRCCQSFPSGHAAWAFSSAAYIQQRYGWGWGAAPYVAAMLVGISRVYSDHHYMRDVVAGALLGVGITNLLTNRYHPKPKSLAVSPIISRKQLGISATLVV